MLDQKKKNILHSLLFSKLEEKLLSYGVYWRHSQELDCVFGKNGSIAYNTTKNGSAVFLVGNEGKEGEAINMMVGCERERDFSWSLFYGLGLGNIVPNLSDLGWGETQHDFLVLWRIE